MYGTYLWPLIYLQNFNEISPAIFNIPYEKKILKVRIIFYFYRWDFKVIFK